MHNPASLRMRRASQADPSRNKRARLLLHPHPDPEHPDTGTRNADPDPEHAYNKPPGTVGNDLPIVGVKPG